jgi:hypothetical protein
LLLWLLQRLEYQASDQAGKAPAQARVAWARKRPVPDLAFGRGGSGADRLCLIWPLAVVAAA